MRLGTVVVTPELKPTKRLVISFSLIEPTGSFFFVISLQKLRGVGGWVCLASGKYVSGHYGRQMKRLLPSHPGLPRYRADTIRFPKVQREARELQIETLPVRLGELEKPRAHCQIPGSSNSLFRK